MHNSLLNHDKGSSDSIDRWPQVVVQAHEFDESVVHTVLLDGVVHFDAVGVWRALGLGTEARDSRFEEPKHFLRTRGEQLRAVRGTNELDVFTQAGVQRCLAFAADGELRARFRRFVRSTVCTARARGLDSVLPAFIVEKRRALGLSQSEVDQRLGTRKGHYAKIEQGKMPSLPLFRRLMVVLQLSADEILGLSATTDV